MLESNQRPTQRQIAQLFWFTSKEDFVGDTMWVNLDLPTRVANFSHRGGFRIQVQSQQKAI
jgi:hypothetical protein